MNHGRPRSSHGTRAHGPPDPASFDDLLLATTHTHTHGPTNFAFDLVRGGSLRLLPVVVLLLLLFAP